MLTPQQIQETSFEKALFGGYDMDSVDDFLEPLTEDYITLYKENSVLKSKMRILVEKLEEYRRQEASMQNAIIAAQKTCDQMVANAEKKCAQMLREAEKTAAVKSQNIGAQIGAENDRLLAAQNVTAQFLNGMEAQMKRQLALLDELRHAELPEQVVQEAARRAFDFDAAPSAPTTQEKADAMIEEIGQHINESIGAGTTAGASANQADFTVHGELSPAKKKIFDDLQFGRTGAIEPVDSKRARKSK